VQSIKKVTTYKNDHGIQHIMPKMLTQDKI